MSSSRVLTKTELVGLLPALRRELEEAQARAQEALTEVANLQQVIRGLEGLSTGIPPNGSLPLFADTPGELPSPPSEGPRGQEAVRQVLKERYPAVVSQPELYREIMRRGWMNPEAKTPQAAVRAAAQRLAGARGAEKVGTGYRWLPPADAQVRNEET